MHDQVNTSLPIYMYGVLSFDERKKKKERNKMVYLRPTRI